MRHRGGTSSSSASGVGFSESAATIRKITRICLGEEPTVAVVPGEHLEVLGHDVARRLRQPPAREQRSRQEPSGAGPCLK